MALIQMIASYPNHIRFYLNTVISSSRNEGYRNSEERNEQFDLGRCILTSFSLGFLKPASLFVLYFTAIQ